MLPLDILKLLCSFLQVKPIIAFLTSSVSLYKCLIHIPLDLSNSRINPNYSFNKERYNIIGYNLFECNLSSNKLLPSWINQNLILLTYGSYCNIDLSIFANCIKLTSLTLKASTVFSSEKFIVPSLKLLDITSVTQFNTSLEMFPNLQYLSRSNFTPHLEYLSHLSSLIYLDISHNIKLIDISGLRYCPLLETLLMSDCPSIIAYPDWEIGNPYLKELSFTITDNSQVNIYNLPYLTKLTLCMIENVTIPLVSNSVTGLTLNLSNIMSSTIKIPDLSSLSKLEELYFYGEKYQNAFIFPFLPHYAYYLLLVVILIV
jgi:hypothetical protein